MARKRRILFVCKYNRFRSRVAAAYFKKLDENKRFEIESAGLIKGEPVNSIAIKVAKEFGLDIKGRTRCVGEEELKKTDLLIVVADNVSPEIFRDWCKNIIAWKVKDTKVINKKMLRNIVKEIIKKVDKLDKRLK